MGTPLNTLLLSFAHTSTAHIPQWTTKWNVLNDIIYSLMLMEKRPNKGHVGLASNADILLRGILIMKSSVLSALANNMSLSAASECYNSPKLAGAHLSSTMYVCRNMLLYLVLSLSLVI